MFHADAILTPEGQASATCVNAGSNHRPEWLSLPAAFTSHRGARQQNAATVRGTRGGPMSTH